MQPVSWIFYKKGRRVRAQRGRTRNRRLLEWSNVRGVRKKVSGTSGTTTFRSSPSPLRALPSARMTRPFSIFARHVFTRWVFISLTAAFIIMNLRGVPFLRRTIQMRRHSASGLVVRDLPEALIRRAPTTAGYSALILNRGFASTARLQWECYSRKCERSINVIIW